MFVDTGVPHPRSWWSDSHRSGRYLPQTTTEVTFKSSQFFLMPRIRVIVRGWTTFNAMKFTGSSPARPSGGLLHPTPTRADTGQGHQIQPSILPHRHRFQGK
jgi:hypothetical protein